MTLTLELPAAAVEILTKKAKNRGLTPEQVGADELLQRLAQTEIFESETFSEEMSGRPMTGAEALALMKRENLFLAPRVGDPDSPELARRIRETAWRRL